MLLETEVGEIAAKDFILTVIKQDYNTNDRLKFILSIIRRDNGLNKQLKAR